MTDLEQSICTNVLWHTANLDMLAHCVKYVRDGNFYAYVALWQCYMQNEQERLRERENIMLRSHIEKLPHKHAERERELTEQLITLLAKRMEGVIS